MAYLFFKVFYFILRLILQHRSTNIEIGRVPHGHYQEEYGLSDEDLKRDDPDYCKDYATDIIYDSRNYRVIYTRFKTYRLVFKNCPRYPIKADNIKDIVDQMFYRDIFR